MRDVFVPPDGCFWWSFDYSGLELHIAAALSQDPDMLRALTEECPDEKCTHKPKHGDLHSMFQVKLETITGSWMERPLVKVGNFEQLYGGGAGKLVEIIAKDRTYISHETATAIVEGHAEAFPRFHEWAAERRAFHRSVGYAQTLFGRRRYIPELYSKDPERRSYGERAGVNHEIQGTAADIVKIAMRLVVPVLRKYGAHMAMQVHDELDGWIPCDSDIEGFTREMVEVMTSVPLPGIKLKVEGGANGLSWAEVH
jgi:DNA polymerase-1